MRFGVHFGPFWVSTRVGGRKRRRTSKPGAPKQTARQREAVKLLKMTDMELMAAHEGHPVGDCSDCGRTHTAYSALFYPSGKLRPVPKEVQRLWDVS